MNGRFESERAARRAEAEADGGFSEEAARLEAELQALEDGWLRRLEQAALAARLADLSDEEEEGGWEQVIECYLICYLMCHLFPTC